MSQTSILVMQTLGKLIKEEDFKQFVSEQLVLQLWHGAVVVMANLKAYPVEGMEQRIEATSVDTITNHFCGSVSHSKIRVRESQMNLLVYDAREAGTVRWIS